MNYYCKMLSVSIICISSTYDVVMLTQSCHCCLLTGKKNKKLQNVQKIEDK
ncbi:Hypothetical protein CINCED_3A005860 [Cinara cedri]|uniref:Uncharacterized protein n=1 Tax=Cinara cedri TaxID=506608 RepID=A0A5E4M3C3_9HEMI|nr:Hypothetical protein CINCED_3A005860 [Cinara cedri]